MTSYGATGSTAGQDDVNPTSSPAGHVAQDAEADTRLTKMRQNLQAFYERNFGLFLVFLAQTCGSVVCSHLSEFYI